MVVQLEPCPRCARHVRVGAPCPFCGAAPELEVSPPLLPDRRLSRFEFVSWKTLVGAGVVGGSISMLASACAVYGRPCDEPCLDFGGAPDASDANTGGLSAAGRSGVGGAAISTGGRSGATSSGGTGGVAGTGATDGGNEGGAGGGGGEQGGEGGA
jgi:hypothetical protein